MPRRALLIGLVLLTAGCGGGGSGPAPRRAPPAEDEPAPSAAAPPVERDWPTFGHDPSRTGVSTAPTGITARTVARLRRRRIALPGTVDSAPIYLHGVHVKGAARNVFVMTTTYGRTLAVDARSGRILWAFTPAGIAKREGSPQITQAGPTADRDRAHVFAASSDGYVHRLALGDGREARGWPVAMTRDATHEKLTSSLNLVGDRLVVATGGYLGDSPPYQGHVVTLDRASGRILAVFNALCADVRRIQDPPSCRSQLAAIWGRAGAVATRDHERVLVATGNGPFDGRRDWGDSVIELRLADLRPTQSWTPVNQADLEATDADLGSASPVVVPGGVLQSGKEGITAVLAADALNGTPRAGPRLGGERQRVPNPGGAGMFNAPAVWTRGGRTTVFMTTFSATAAYDWRGGRLIKRWEDATGATSPILAGGLLYLYDPGGRLVVRAPGDGRVLARLPAGPGHWNSPVVGDGVVALPEGNGNEHRTDGILNLYSTR